MFARASSPAGPSRPTRITGPRACAELYYLIATNGDKGGRCYDASATPLVFYDCPKEDLAALRRTEALDAAAHFNVSVARVRFLDLEDSKLASYPSASVRLKLVAYIRKVRPFAVFTFNAEFNYLAPPMTALLPYGYDDIMIHPDHRAIGALTRDCIFGYETSSALMFDELLLGACPVFPHSPRGLHVGGLRHPLDAGLQPWTVSQFYMFAVTAPPMTHYVALAAADLDAKIAAFGEHRSQVQNETSAVAQYFLWLAGKVASNAGLATNSLAEGYTAFF